MYQTASIFSSGWGDWSASSHSSISELLLLLSRLQDLETAHKSIINWHHSTCIIEFSTIVRGTEKCNKLSLGKEFIAIFHNLMCSTDQINVMLFIEGWNNFLTEGKTDSSVVFTPTLNVLIRIWPKEITKETCVRDIGWSHDSLDLF